MVSSQNWKKEKSVWSHLNHKTTYTDPRLAFAVEENESPTDIRQRFDASTSALQILHGRDLGGKVAIVTGANCGIGFETARSLAYHGCEVYFACRSKDKAKAAIEQICKERPNSNLHFLPLDLSSLQSVSEFCKKFEVEKKLIHMLILNAGVFGLPHSLTEDGFEETFQVNHLGHFYLVKLLTPILIQSSPCRIVLLSSESHRFSFLTKENISEAYLSPKTPDKFYSIMAYNDSKLCNILFSNELNRRLSSKGVFSNAVHPGNVVSSYLSRNWWFYRILFALIRPFTKSLQQAAATSIYCATAHELGGVGGMYFNNCYQCKPSQTSASEDLSKMLWELSETMINRS
ncbi:WW domain-containing oxidoreductase isoform X2 [Parasteatoda tepidariorum]|uniref:WW domain-containing oxidoreductase isoform X2 n=1 Tax=Parasteatoda tepidariorum TaxID=114398 RepID=UPI00077FE1B5|nr:WW domain-containing oxidoreductase isoform X2 [Parasteatoda tepidariorum]